MSCMFHIDIHRVVFFSIFCSPPFPPLPPSPTPPRLPCLFALPFSPGVLACRCPAFYYYYTMVTIMCKLADFQSYTNNNDNNNQTQAAVADTRNAHKISHNKNFVSESVCSRVSSASVPKSPMPANARTYVTLVRFNSRHCPLRSARTVKMYKIFDGLSWLHKNKCVYVRQAKTTTKQSVIQ